MFESLAVRMTRRGDGNRAEELRRREGRSPAGREVLPSQEAAEPPGAQEPSISGECYLEKVAVSAC